MSSQQRPQRLGPEPTNAYPHQPLPVKRQRSERTPEPTDTPSAAILAEARGAHAKATEILDLMSAPKDGAPSDPIDEITATLRDLLRAVNGLTTRLDGIERLIRNGPRG